MMKLDRRRKTQDAPSATERQAARTPGPFLEDEATEAPFDLPRPGTVTPRSCVWDEVRHPNPTFSE